MADGAPKQSYAERVASQLIEQLEAGTAPWQKPWDPNVATGGMPQNPISGKRYRGINAVYLMAQGHADPRWCTYNQANDKGWQVRRGEKGISVEYWQWEKDEKGVDGKKHTVKLDRPKVFWATVFHASQIDGIPEFVPPVRIWDPNERAEALLKASGAWIEHRDGDAAFYSPASDRIILPLVESFKTDDRYYATALHELSHWSGGPSRLARDMTGTFASESYAKEELRAEIGSLMIGNELGIGHDPGQHASYVKSWIKALKEDPREIFRAAADAEKIHGFLMAFDPRHVLQQAQVKQEREQEDAPAQEHERNAPRKARAARSRKPDRQAAPVMEMSR